MLRIQQHSESQLSEDWNKLMILCRLRPEPDEQNSSGFNKGINLRVQINDSMCLDYTKSILPLRKPQMISNGPSSVAEILCQLDNLQDEISVVRAAVQLIFQSKKDKIQELESITNPYSDCSTAICNTSLELNE